MTLRITNNRNRTWNGCMISFNRNMSYMSKQIFIHFIILPSSFNIIIFFIAILILIISVSCNDDVGMFLIKYIEYFMYDHPFSLWRSLLWIGFKWKWQQSCSISKICLCNEFICYWVLTLSLEEFYLVLEVLIF